MFEQLFAYRTVLARHKNASFAKEREQYLEFKAQTGRAKGTLLNSPLKKVLFFGTGTISSGQAEM